ncbi:MAG: archease [Chloroflexi bacterium]|nr:archease [Chloroflexota bacterium]
MHEFEIIEHTAEVGILAHGRTLDEVFAHAATGMFALLVDLDQVREAEARPVEVAAEGLESLLVDWLNELVFIFDVEQRLFRRFEVSVSPQPAAPAQASAEPTAWRLVARAYGERVDAQRHLLGAQIKAATYYLARVWPEQGLWHARVIFDV